MLRGLFLEGHAFFSAGPGRRPGSTDFRSPSTLRKFFSVSDQAPATAAQRHLAIAPAKHDVRFFSANRIANFRSGRKCPGSGAKTAASINLLIVKP